VGLLGGSVGLSLRRSGIHVVGYSRRPEGCRAAVEAGAIDEGCTQLEQACEGSDCVVVAAPVDKIAELAAAAADCLEPHALITDVGSTKARITEELLQRWPVAAARFVAAHPIAGSEKTGVEHATASLLDGKVVVLTPHPGLSTDVVERAEAFWRQAGGTVVRMSPHEHDRHLAAISHVPHLLASLLANFPEAESLPLVGSGWQDMTRVAAGDPGMWTAICQHNRHAIVQQLDRFAAELAELRTRVAGPDPAELMRWLEAAKRRKQAVS
jgi:prephenate dehydrogenase